MDAVRKVPSSWSLDGRYIIYEGPTATGAPRGGLWILPLFGDAKPIPFLQPSYLSGHAEISPDGHWVAYESTESGNYEIYVQSFPAPGAKKVVTVGGGVEPRWRRDGKELFYLSPDRTLMAVPMKTAAEVEAGKPAPLFKLLVDGLKGARVRNQNEIIATLMQLRPEQLAQLIQVQ